MLSRPFEKSSRERKLWLPKRLETKSPSTKRRLISKRPKTRLLRKLKKRLLPLSPRNDPWTYLKYLLFHHKNS